MAIAVVVEAEEGLVGARRVVEVRLGNSTAENKVAALGRNASSASTLVPRETALAPVDKLKLAGGEARRDRRHSCIAGIWDGHVVTGRVAKRSVDGSVEWPSHQQESLGHLAGLAMRQATVAGDGIVGDWAALGGVSQKL